jgi:hypothetical protein
MANLLGQNIGSNYRGILNLDATTINTPLDTILRAVTDGMGNVSALQLSTTQIGISTNGAVSISPLYGFGTWFTGGTTTTTKPYFLLEPSGTTSNAWNTLGTGLGLNATASFSGNLIDLQVGASSRFYVRSDGYLFSAAAIQSGTFLQGNSLRFNSLGRLQPASDGVFTLLDNNITSFNRLQFGGTTNLFPSIKRIGANLEFKLADDSGFCFATASAFYASALFSTGGYIFHGSGAIYQTDNTSARLNIFTGGYSIEVNGATAISASALFTLNSTTKGFLPPRMTTAEINLIGTPANGLVVYNTTIGHLCVCVAGVWYKLSHSTM